MNYKDRFNKEGLTILKQARGIDEPASFFLLEHESGELGLIVIHDQFGSSVKQYENKTAAELDFNYILDAFIEQFGQVERTGVDQLIPPAIAGHLLVF